VVQLKKLENLMQNLTILLCVMLPHFHGQFATDGDWHQVCPPWIKTIAMDA
jgi:hypothetical protein